MRRLTMEVSHFLAIFFTILLLASSTVEAVKASGCSASNTGSNPKNSIYMSNGECTNHCQGYAFGIVQGKTCWCSNIAPSSMDGSCEQSCPGYPYEKCGGDSAFSYIRLGTPSGTAGASSAAPTSSEESTETQSSQQKQQDPPPPAPSTVVETNFQTQVQTQVQTEMNLIFSTKVSTQPRPSVTPSVFTPDPVTIIQKATSAPPRFTPEPSSEESSRNAPPSTSQGPSSVAEITTTAKQTTETPKPSVVTTAEVVTVSGAVITNLMTSASTSSPTPTSNSDQSNELPEPSGGGLSKGAVAGVTIGALIGAALIGVLLWFFCWRRRQAKDGSEEGGLSRNTSVLGRVGLLGSEKRKEASTAPTLPRIRTTGIGPGIGPDSAATAGSSQMSEQNRRNSRPMFVDQRLNPNALMAHHNASRTSVGTLQDNHDYSRPLEVRNPDF